MPLPVYLQETPYSYVAACLRIVFAHFGTHVTEDELRERSYTTLWGTSTTDAVRCAVQYGFEATLERGTAQELGNWIADGFSPIVIIRLPSYGKHVVVIESLERAEIVYIDPADGKRHKEPLETLLATWQGGGGETLLIRGIKQ
ncbi:MAG: hypothetical protein HY741_08450 [Chloroflexi bacterium]|nr:hypothetical protein [Chloroflexota bacterium]